MLFANVSTLGGRILNIVGITIYYEEKERQEKKKGVLLTRIVFNECNIFV